MVKHNALSQGLFAVVDDQDYEWLNQWRWTAHLGPGGRVAAYRKVGQNKGHMSRNLWMHRVILNAPTEAEVDHINGDSLDNRRENLRLATRAQNLRNRRTFKNSKSRYKGVVYNPLNGKWKVIINFGTFDSPEDAAQAYDEAIKKLFGKFAKASLDE
jgi:hypothetical protein